MRMRDDANLKMSIALFLYIYKKKILKIGETLLRELNQLWNKKEWKGFVLLLEFVHGLQEIRHRIFGNKKQI